MSEAARKYINDYCTKHRISTDALEKRASLSRDVLYAFLSRKTSDIKLSNAIKIANTLSISLEELLGKSRTQKKIIKRSITPLPVNINLLNNIINFLLSYIKYNKLHKYSFKQLMYAVSEIYEHCAVNKLEKIDENFAKSLCERLHLFR
jgi:hypothetical protein